MYIGGMPSDGYGRVIAVNDHDITFILKPGLYDVTRNSYIDHTITAADKATFTDGTTALDYSKSTYYSALTDDIWADSIYRYIDPSAIDNLKEQSYSQDLYETSATESASGDWYKCVGDGSDSVYIIKKSGVHTLASTKFLPVTIGNIIAAMGNNVEKCSHINPITSDKIKYALLNDASGILNSFFTATSSGTADTVILMYDSPTGRFTWDIGESFSANYQMGVIITLCVDDFTWEIQ